MATYCYSSFNVIMLWMSRLSRVLFVYRLDSILKFWRSFNLFICRLIKFPRKKLHSKVLKCILAVQILNLNRLDLPVKLVATCTSQASWFQFQCLMWWRFHRFVHFPWHQDISQHRCSHTFHTVQIQLRWLCRVDKLIEDIRYHSRLADMYVTFPIAVLEEKD